LDRVRKFAFKYLKIKNMKKVAVALIAGLITFSCSSLKVTTDFDKTVDFAEYKTLEYYGWAENSDKILNRLDKDRIENAFGNEFEKRGVSLAEKGEGDMIVTLYIVTEDKVDRSSTTSGMGGYGGYYGYGPGYGYGGGSSVTTYSEYEYREGTLIVSVYDAEKKQLVWESVGKGTIEENPKKREDNMDTVAAQIMKEYPVAPIEEAK
jgi:hypothetical protein